MHLEGNHIVNSSVGDVWRMLLDPDTLTRIIPGLSSLEAQSNGVFIAKSDIKMGPVNGSFSGTMEVVDKNEPQSFTLLIKQNGKIGNVSAEGKIQLKAINGKETEIVFSGDAKLSGTLARTGQRVLSGVANALTNQFFESLDNQILESQGKEIPRLNFFQKLFKWMGWFFGKKQKT